ncbi:MAG TPA: GDP-mannose 4,6-dehydratase, partial [Bacteroidota bacterium]|nr:GDP-mannose 4,6-dehydratase [Bacteroidota bacterium]
MSKYLITGFSGFVSSHFLRFLESRGEPVQVLGIDLEEPLTDPGKFKHVRCTFEQIDLLDEEKIQKAIERYQPDYILHLAAYSSVSFSWKNPILSFQNNTNIFLNLIEAVRQLNLKTRILSVGSSEEYGNVSERELPLREDRPLMPLSPYAVARVSQEMLSQIYAKGFGVNIVITRSFNHIGPGQREMFVVSSFAKQIAEGIRDGRSKIDIVTGDISITRDFLDVRDVVRAYQLLLHKGRVGEIYNVCSGRGVKLSEIISMLGRASGVTVVPRTDSQLVRPQDNRVIVGSNEKIFREVGWKPVKKLEDSLADVVEYWTE